MKTYSPQVFLALILLCSFASAQNTNSMLPQYDAKKMGAKVANDYRNAHGQYLWSKDWHRALISMRNGNNIMMKAIKVNLYTNELHYPDRDIEMAFPVDNIRQVILYSNDAPDTTAIIATFEILPVFSARSDVALNGNKFFLYQVLNNGKVQLLKRVVVGGNEMKVDPIIDNQMMYFYSTPDYVIRNDKNIKWIKSLSKTNVLEVIRDEPGHKDWLASNKNKLKNEEDAVAFFNYLNSK